MVPMLTASRFKTLALARPITGRAIKRADPASAYGVRKQTVEGVEEAGERKLRFVISTAAVDRDRDTIDPKGWKLDAFRKNPVVLWAHDGSNLPIGRALDLEQDGQRLAATVDFLAPDTYGKASEFADIVYRLAKDGFLSATSVGFCPLEWDVTTDKDRGADSWFPGIDFRSQELVEFSIVTVPSNPEALLEPAAPPREEVTPPPPDANQEATTSWARRCRRHALQLIELGG